MIWMDRARARAQVGVGPTASKSPAQPAVWIHAFVGEFQLGLSLVRLRATGVLWGFRLSVPVPPASGYANRLHLRTLRPRETCVPQTQWQIPMIERN